MYIIYGLEYYSLGTILEGWMTPGINGGTWSDGFGSLSSSGVMTPGINLGIDWDVSPSWGCIIPGTNGGTGSED